LAIPCDVEIKNADDNGTDLMIEVKIIE